VRDESSYNPDLVGTGFLKAKTDVNRVATLIKRTQQVNLCFVLDTTGNMASYISGVKDQIIQIVTEVQVSLCSILDLSCVE